jgi:hypothetical protein
MNRKDKISSTSKEGVRITPGVALKNPAHAQ